ncbi:MULTISPECIES: major capsid protein [Aeromonas]|uniref:Phage major capsid protein n=1 Tax=Aeromonas veronii TaxID=654 RepID=A0AAX2UQ47_AERVE|nr:MULTISPECIES: phage major capsid protein [Aeromonas]MCD6618764.1 phage major capsid protein [Aeromonas veronii]QWZ66383.1 phage major capsid protein [Aeromonas sp. FDAARGOS 1417]TND51896.1 phage major capsid protein [Aeromonas veronii]BEE07092.1 hypothetical protein VAWG002_42880 [Aeromonas veronii]
MPLLREEAAKLSQEDMLRGVIEEFINKDDLFGILPFAPTTGKALVYHREKTLANGDWLDPNDEVKESASTFDEVTTQLRILIGDVDVDKFLDGTMSNVNSQKAIQIASKLKGMRTQFQDALINGTQAKKQFDGLNTLVNAKQIIDAKGYDMGFSMFDELTDAVKLGADCLMMRSEHVRAYKAMLRLMGGNNGGMIQLPNFDRPILAHDGVPILVNDFIQKKDGKADIFAFHLDENSGLHGLFASNHPAGFAIEDLGTVQNKDATRTRIKMYVGMALKATHALAKLSNVKLPGAAPTVGG